MEQSCNSHINWAQPSISQDDFYSLKDCFDSKQLSQGKKVEEFEELVAANSDRKYCICVNSGSSALISLLISLGVSNTSEIIIPAMSFIALPHAITMLGALPVLADIDKTTGMITRETVLPCISKNTSAIIGIDYSGFVNDWTDLAKMCDQYGITLIIDAASSFLATNKGRPAGSYGKAAIFSFHSAKTITTGEGGAIVTDDKNLASLLKQIRNHGELHGHKYFYNSLGSNFRMTDISASLGIAQIRRKNQILSHRQQVVNEYLENNILKEVALIGYSDSDLVSNGFTFTILCESRDRIERTLHDYGVDTRVMWPCTVDQQPVYQRHPIKKVGEINNARYFSQSCLSLPVHPGIGKKEVDYITNVIERSICTATQGI